jgi:tetratricopeptide (TPR) repeat protein
MCLVVVLLVALHLVIQPDPRDALRDADRLLLAGNYHAALHAYLPLADHLPTAHLRIGMLYTLRGESAAAELALRRALDRVRDEREYHLALLYLGQALADEERSDLAADTWNLIADCQSAEACMLRGPAQLLAAEQQLWHGEFAAAAAAYQQALQLGLPADWVPVAAYRLRLLEQPISAAQIITPPLFLDLLRPQIGSEAEQYAAILALPAAEQAQARGQWYLALGLYDLAAAQFAQVMGDALAQRNAAAYAAYTRWRAGDATGGRAQLEQLAAEHPTDPQVRMLLALAYLTVGQADEAAQQITAVAQRTPGAAAVELAWANWYAAQREYAEAALAYQRALALSEAAERGRYALLGAQFHLATTYDLCTAGIDLAMIAADALPRDPEAQSTLAAIQYGCGQFRAALAAAQASQALAARPDAAYYLGMTQIALGDTAAARSALIQAADLAPRSRWRERAESALAQLGPTPSREP